MDAQMKKGVLEMCLLQLIAQRETYGYELVKEVTEIFPEISESTVYAVLRRLGADGRVQVNLCSVAGAPDRRYFRLTGKGRERLDDAIADWHELAEAVKRIGIL